ncbi:tail fiber protein [Baekduia alba]|nr:tail fiber protein [Baekduia alba]
MVVASLALFIALGGPATAAHLIDGATIKGNSITTKQVRNRTLGVQDLSKSAVKALQTSPSLSVGAKQLRDGAVGTKALADRAVDATKIAPGAVGNSHLASKAVDGGKLADGAVGNAQLGTDAVTSAKVADGAIGAGAIADGGLQTRDIGDFYGSVSVPFGDFTANQCKVVTINAQASVPGQSNSIADDIVAASPTTSGWPDPIIVTANPGANNTIRIIACRLGGDAPTDPPVISAPTTTFYYVAFDTP